MAEKTVGKTISVTKFIAFIKAVAADFNYLKRELNELKAKSTVSEERVIELVKQTNSTAGVVSSETIAQLDRRVTVLEEGDTLDYAEVYRAAKEAADPEVQGQPVTHDGADAVVVKDPQ